MRSCADLSQYDIKFRESKHFESLSRYSNVICRSDCAAPDEVHHTRWLNSSLACRVMQPDVWPLPLSWKLCLELHRTGKAPRGLKARFISITRRTHGRNCESLVGAASVWRLSGNFCDIRQCGAVVELKLSYILDPVGCVGAPPGQVTKVCRIVGDALFSFMLPVGELIRVSRAVLNCFSTEPRRRRKMIK